jgi:hypothetical protein
MKTFAMIALCTTFVLAAGCGLQEDETPAPTTTPDAGDTPSPDGGTPTPDGGDPTPTPDGGTTPDPDTTAPVVAIVSPVGGSGLDAASVTVTGTATDAVGVASVKVNGVACTLTGTDFSCENVPLPVAGSETTLTAEAKDAAGNTGTASVTVMVYLPAPFRSPGPFVLDVSVAYISASLCAELRGNLPGMSWDSGPFVKDESAGSYDGYAGTVYSAAPGSYNLSYVDRECPGETATPRAWAQYGNLKLQVSKMSPAARAFLSCTQYVPASNSCQAVSNPGCNIAFTVAADGTVSPNGNMGGFDPATATGCW